MALQDKVERHLGIDLEDSADLMNLIRHELGFSKMESRFPTKGTCLAIYSRAVTIRQGDGVKATETILLRGAPPTHGVNA